MQQKHFIYLKIILIGYKVLSCCCKHGKHTAVQLIQYNATDDVQMFKYHVILH